MATLAMPFKDGYDVAIKRRNRGPVLIDAVPAKEGSEENPRENEGSYFGRAGHP